MAARERTMTIFKRLRKDEKGQATVEFALTVVLLVLFIVGFLELVTLVYTYNVLADSAKEGVRYAIVHGANNATASGPASGAASSPPCTASSANVGEVQTAVKNYAGSSFHDISAMTINVCYFDGDNQASHRVQVTVHYPYQPFFGLGWPTVTVNAAAAARIAY
jgi:Flp pilus assembly protein TadG